MSDVATSRFSCESCGRSYALKPELLGRRVKCKCGQVMTVPQPPPEPSELRLEDDLYDIAPESPAPAAKPATSRVPLAPVAPRAPLAPINGGGRSTATVATHAPVGATPVPAAADIPLAYQKGPTQRERERMSSDVLMDMTRDVYVPVALMIVGFLTYVGYYTIRYELDGAGIAMTSMGLGITTAFKAALLIGFAFVVAGPTGVSFGGIWTAALKLAAIAVFNDGVATWIDAGVQKMTGGAGGFFAGAISFPVILTLYWGLLIYLFSMDGGDSWLVVVLLAVFDLIVRTVLVLLLLKLILTWGGVSGTALATLGGGKPGPTNPMTLQVTELKEMDLLREAREYIQGGRQLALTKPVDEWYAAGCKNVWFSVARDFDGKATPTGAIVELPKDKMRQADARKRCYEIYKGYLDEHKFHYRPQDVVDNGDPYIFVPIRTGGRF